MPEVGDSKYLVIADWDDVPHLDEDEKRMLLDSTPPHLKEARSKGIPSMGAGAIYPIPESDILVEPFEIPYYWPRAAGLDVGWNKTAGVWGAVDRNAGTAYLYSEYYRGEAEPSVHANGIRARGDWIPQAIDPASRGRGQRDGEQLFQDYLDLGLNLIAAENTVEAGIYTVWEMLSTGRLKVFNTLKNWLMEYRLYRRDEKGKVVKQNDHLMDATRYFAVTGIHYAVVEPKPRANIMNQFETRNRFTGY